MKYLRLVLTQFIISCLIISNAPSQSFNQISTDDIINYSELRIGDSSTGSHFIFSSDYGLKINDKWINRSFITNEQASNGLFSDTVYLKFDVKRPHYYFTNKKQLFDGLYQGHWINDYLSRIVMREGIYNVIVSKYFGNSYYYIVKEKVELENNDTIYVSRLEATNLVKLFPFDEDGRPFDSLDGIKKMNLTIHLPDSLSMDVVGILNATPNSFVLLSNMSEGFVIQPSMFHADVTNEKEVHMATFEPQFGINQNVNLYLDHNEYISQGISIKPAIIDSSNLKIAVLQGCKVLGGINIWLHYMAGQPEDINSLDWEGQIYQTSEFCQRFGHIFRIYLFDNNSLPLISPQAFSVFNDSIINTTTSYSPNFVRSANEGLISYAEGPVSFKAYFDNKCYNDTIGYIRFHNKPIIMGTKNEVKFLDSYDATLCLYDKDYNLLDSNKVLAFLNYIDIKQEYIIKVKSEKHLVAGKQAEMIWESRFDFNNSEAIPPNVYSFQLRDESQIPVESIDIQDRARLNFSAMDYYFSEEHYLNNVYSKMNYVPLQVDSTRLMLRKPGNNEWDEVEVSLISEDEFEGGFFQTEINDYISNDTGYYDARVYVEDLAGNNVTYTLKPAFRVIDENVSISESEYTDRQKLLQCFPNPFSEHMHVEYFVPHDQIVKLYLYDSYGHLLGCILNEKKSKGSHSFEIDTKTSFSLASGIYYCVLELEDKKDIVKVIKI